VKDGDGGLEVVMLGRAEMLDWQLGSWFLDCSLR